MLLSELCESNGPRSFCAMTMLDFFFPPPAEEEQRRKPVSMSLGSSVDARKAEVDAPPAPPAEPPPPPAEPAPPPPGDDDDVCRVCFDVVGENADDDGLQQPEVEQNPEKAMVQAHIKKLRDDASFESF